MNNQVNCKWLRHTLELVFRLARLEQTQVADEVLEVHAAAQDVVLVGVRGGCRRAGGRERRDRRARALRVRVGGAFGSRLARLGVRVVSVRVRLWSAEHLAHARGPGPVPVRPSASPALPPTRWARERREDPAARHAAPAASERAANERRRALREPTALRVQQAGTRALGRGRLGGRGHGGGGGGCGDRRLRGHLVLHERRVRPPKQAAQSDAHVLRARCTHRIECSLLMRSEYSLLYAP